MDDVTIMPGPDPVLAADARLDARIAVPDPVFTEAAVAVDVLLRTATRFIVHDSLVRRGDSNYIARVDLAPFGLPGEAEQLWRQRREDGLLELCCIPFRAYGLSLACGFPLGRRHVAVGVVRKSGRRVLRVFLMPAVNTSTVLNEIIGEVSRLRLLSELERRPTCCHRCADLCGSS